MRKIKISILFCLFVLSLFFWKVNTSKAFLGTAACNAKGGSCGWVFCGSDEDRLGLCDYGIDPCCRKKLVDTSGADPDPIGAGIGAGGVLQDPNVTPGPGTLGSGAKGGTVTPGTSGIPTTATSPIASPSSGNENTGGLVPCKNNCTLCHLVLGLKNIYDYLLTLLLAATTLVVVVAGVMYMVSSGDKGMIDKAKSALTYALTAMILGLTAWLIINATLSALGYTKVGSWWNFTCDTAQTQGPTGGTGVGTLPGNNGTGKGGGITGKGSDIQVPQDGSKLAQILEKEKSAIYAWGGDPNSRNVNGNLNTDCSGWVQTIYKETYGVNIPRSSSEQGNQAFNYSQLKNGTILESPGHVGIYYNGSVYHNSGTGRDVQVVNLDNYLGNHNVTEIRLPPS
jgi:cell wall-associated NlpC family hydrolase